MDGESVCKEIGEILNRITKGQGTAEDIEKIREVWNNWDEYACWGDDR